MRILNLGSINIDYVYSVPHFVRAGETLSSSARQIFPGGKGMNQSIALARAGADCYHAGMIGNDGAYLLEIFREANVDTGLIAQVEEPTGHTIIQVSPSGENCILLYGGANRALNKDFVDKAISPFDKGDILVLQNEVACVGYAMEAAKARGMDIVFNPSPIGPEIHSYPLNMIDLWLLNEIEGQALTNKENPRDILNAMGTIYPAATIVLTLGKDGVLCRAAGSGPSAAKIYQHKSFEVNVVDTTAAGDTFTGYFIGAIAKNFTIPEALKLASKAASISVSRQGAAVSIPQWDEVIIT